VMVAEDGGSAGGSCASGGDDGGGDDHGGAGQGSGAGRGAPPPLPPQHGQGNLVGLIAEQLQVFRKMKRLTDSDYEVQPNFENLC